MKNQKKKSFPRRVFLCLLAVLLAVCIAFDIYVSDYYHTDPAAEDAMVSDRFVSVTEQNGNWVFAPESPTAGLIFYPGGKVENTAYAPLLHDLAEDGILCVLVKMPCNLAVLDRNAADSIPERFSEVTDWYIGGHSLGGAMAASYAAKHTDELTTLVAYYLANKPEDSDWVVLPVSSFNNYFGSTVFSKQVLKAVTGTVIQRSDMAYGSVRYRVMEEFL